jgi:hypothetical protein
MPAHPLRHATYLSCCDEAGRRRDLAVAVDDRGRVLVQLLPGEPAVFTPAEAQKVRAALDVAAAAAHLRRAAHPRSA